MLVPTAEQLSVYSYDQACRLGALNSNQTTCAHQIFWSSQHAADAQVGLLLDGLRERHVWTETVIVLSTDNGPEEPMVYTNVVGTTGPLRGRKRSLYDGGVRVPFILAYPGKGRRGVVDHSVVGAVRIGSGCIFMQCWSCMCLVGSHDAGRCVATSHCVLGRETARIHVACVERLVCTRAMKAARATVRDHRTP